MDLSEIMLDKITSDLLFMNGQQDRKAGISIYNGWKEIAESIGFSQRHTPARERYEDGWYQGA